MMSHNNDVTHVGRVGNQFPKKDFLVGIEGVDNERHQLGDFSLKGEGLDLFILNLNFNHYRNLVNRPTTYF